MTYKQAGKPKVLNKETKSVKGIGSVTFTTFDRPEDSGARVRAEDEHGNMGWGKDYDAAKTELEKCIAQCDCRKIKRGGHREDDPIKSTPTDRVSRGRQMRTKGGLH